MSSRVSITRRLDHRVECRQTTVLDTRIQRCWKMTQVQGPDYQIGTYEPVPLDRLRKFRCKNFRMVETTPRGILLRQTPTELLGTKRITTIWIDDQQCNHNGDGLNITWERYMSRSKRIIKLRKLRQLSVYSFHENNLSKILTPPVTPGLLV